MYIMYQDGEEIAKFETAEDVKTEVTQLRNDFTIDEEQDMARYPDAYASNYVAGVDFDLYFRDVYSVALDVDVEQFL